MLQVHGLHATAEDHRVAAPPFGSLDAELETELAPQVQPAARTPGEGEPAQDNRLVQELNVQVPAGAARGSQGPFSGTQSVLPKMGDQGKGREPDDDFQTEHPDPAPAVGRPFRLAP